MTRSSKIRYFGLAFILVTALFAGLVLNTHYGQVPEIHGAILPTPQLLPEFELRDHRGELVHRADLNGSWQLVSYGYTQCPDICPTMMSSLAQFQKLLDKRQQYGDLQIIFYTIDPQRDSIYQLANYVPWFDRRFVGLRPDSAEQGGIFERSLGMSSVVSGADSENADNYQVAHGFRLYLLDDQARFRAALAPITERDGSKHYDPAILLKEYLALRHWFSRQG
jgi:protein SCO1/2